MWNSSEGSLKVYFSDGDSNQWVDASPGGVITGGGASVQLRMLLHLMQQMEIFGGSLILVY